ncbi:MAG: hypothetical protein M3391_08255 [Actinomycetota bacterium]|nr:hypothetical protein [Actinomycetota bacterium]
MNRAIGAALGALAGLAFSTMGLVDASNGFKIITLGGNDATPIVTAVGVAIGALLGITVLWRYPLAILGTIVGLAAGIFLRDNATMGSVQPPWVFFLLFGLPAVGAAAGSLLHKPRATWARYSTAGVALTGLAVATVSYTVGSVLWASATHDPRCDPIPQPDGSVFVQLCADTSTPLWIGLVVAVMGVAAGMFTHVKLTAPDAPSSDVSPETS